MYALTPGDLDRDRDAIHLSALIDRLRCEIDTLTSVIPAAVDAQWSRSYRPRSAEDAPSRVTGVISDPTADAALDDQRRKLRDQVVRSESTLRAATIAVRGVRRGLEMTLAAWQGEAE